MFSFLHIRALCVPQWQPGLLSLLTFPFFIRRELGLHGHFPTWGVRLKLRKHDILDLSLWFSDSYPHQGEWLRSASCKIMIWISDHLLATSCFYAIRKDMHWNANMFATHSRFVHTFKPKQKRGGKLTSSLYPLPPKENFLKKRKDKLLFYRLCIVLHC